jgi:predicted methyltransferase
MAILDMNAMWESRGHPFCDEELAGCMAVEIAKEIKRSESEPGGAGAPAVYIRKDYAANACKYFVVWHRFAGTAPATREMAVWRAVLAALGPGGVVNVIHAMGYTEEEWKREQGHEPA